MKQQTWNQMKKRMVLAVLLVAAGCSYSCTRKETGTALLQAGQEIQAGQEPGQEQKPEPEPAGRENGPGQESQPGHSDQTESTAPEPAVCYVHICGEVRRPGVYQLKEGQRIYEALELAGGCTEEGAADYLNLAGLVEDGMKLVVPSAEELSGQPEADLYGTAASAGGDQPAKVNINRAGKEQLMTLTGIGESRAEDILRYREEQGKFETIEDIMNVSGIKQAAFDKIKDEITV